MTERYNNVSHKYTFLNNHGREMADMLTGIRIFIVFLIIYLSFFSSIPYSYTTVLTWILLGWITDVFDGRLARSDKTFLMDNPSWFGRNERKVDLFVVGGAHLYLSQFVMINPFIIYAIGGLGLLSFLQLYRTGDTDLLSQMLYITLVCGYIIIKSFSEEPFIGTVTLIFLIGLIVVTWDTFKGRVFYFLSLERINFE